MDDCRKPECRERLARIATKLEKLAEVGATPKDLLALAFYARYPSRSDD